jgi:hypothetical protein
LFESRVIPPGTLADVDTLRRVKTVSTQDADVSVLPGDIILQAARPRLMYVQLCNAQCVLRKAKPGVGRLFPSKSTTYK